MQWQFGDFTIDADARQLTGPDGPIHVEPQVFAVLEHLARHRERAVSKEELLDEVWGDRFVSEAAITSRIRTARAVLGDSGRAQRVIRTVHGFGYQFVAALTEGAVTPSTVTGVTGVAERGHGLPRFHNPFRGRVGDLATLEGLVEAERLVTVVGPGGTGKTRLAVEHAAVQEALDPKFVDLAAVRDPAAVPFEVLTAMGIRMGEHADPAAAVAAYLRATTTLLLLDNCEHVLDAAGVLVAAVVTADMSSRVLATSREPLGVLAEHLFHLHPLPLIDEGADLDTDSVLANAAVAVFVDRARQVQHDFELTGDEPSIVAQLCRALDGLPLALELAAGRMSAMGLGDLVRRLDQRLDSFGDRVGTRDERHRSLRATVEWSYESLGDDQQRLLRHLSVLPAGATLDTIEWLVDRLEMTETGFDLALGLVDASLLQRADAPSGVRYQQLETLRVFGIEQLELLGELEIARDHLATWALGLLTEAAVGLRADAEVTWNDRLEYEFANVRAARAHLRARQRMDELLQLSTLLSDWARYRGATEIWSWTDDVVELSRAGLPEQLGRGLALRAQGRWTQGSFGEALADGRRALELTTDPLSRRIALSELGAAYLFSGEIDNAIAAWRDEDELAASAIARGAAAVAAVYKGDVELARSLAEGSREVAEVTRAPTQLAWAAYATGEVAHISGGGDPVPPLEQAISLASASGASFIVGVASVTLSSVMAERGEIDAAATLYGTLLDHWSRSGSWTQQWTTLRNAAGLLAEFEPALAIDIIESAAADPRGPALSPDAASDLHAVVERAREQLGVDYPAVPRTRQDLVDLASAALGRMTSTANE